jgi:hypothetical protein
VFKKRQVPLNFVAMLKFLIQQIEARHIGKCPMAYHVRKMALNLRRGFVPQYLILCGGKGR